MNVKMMELQCNQNYRGKTKFLIEISINQKIPMLNQDKAKAC